MNDTAALASPMPAAKGDTRFQQEMAAFRMRWPIASSK